MPFVLCLLSFGLDLWCLSQILANGGATHITSWGKFWLAVLGCYSWDGMNPTPPEIWLLPYASWTGIGLTHPGRFWCHCRMVRQHMPCCTDFQAASGSNGTADSCLPSCSDRCITRRRAHCTAPISCKMERHIDAGS